MWSVGLLATTTALVLIKDLDEIVKWTSVLGFFVALISLLLSLTPRPDTPAPGLVQQLDQAAEDLAAAVRMQWREEERLRRVHDPFPLDVRWSAGDESLTDRWAGHRGRGSAAPRSRLAGRLAEAVRVYRNVPSGRLVVIGAPGAGKTVWTLRFTLDLIASRRPRDPIPVIFPLHSWNPVRQSLDFWMAGVLAIDYPALGAPAPSGSTWAGELIRAGRLLPVLDGLDEVPRPLRAEAVRHLNTRFDNADPMVLTCRADQYRETVEAAGVLAGAAVVELEALSLADLASYLPRTTRQPPPGGGAVATKWEPVLTRLREEPRPPAARALLTVLSTPLMTSLARTAYSDTPADPADLLSERFTGPAALEEHLLDSFLPAAYATRPMAPGPSSGPAQVRCTPEQAQVWLGWAARHLDRRGTSDLAWWELADAVPRPTGALAVGCAAGLVFGTVGLLAAGPATCLAYGIGYAFAGGIAYGLGRRRGPSRVRLRFRGTAKPFARRFAVGLTTGLVLALAFGLRGVVVIVNELAFGLAFGLHVWLNRPADAAHVPGPHVALRQDRTAALAFGFSYAISLGLAYGASFFADDVASGTAVPLVLGLSFSPTYGVAGAVTGLVAGGIAYGPVGAFSYLVGSALLSGIVLPPMHDLGYGIFLGTLFGLSAGSLGILSRAWGSSLFARAWLALHGHQPWRLMRFLADAHRRGVLRQTGGVYQFRHLRLQSHLARSERPHGRG